MADKGKPKDTNRLKARLPRGLMDRGPAEIAATRRMLETIRKVYELYGFEPVETPAIEFTDALGKFLPDQDRPNEGVFSFQDDDEQWLSLRYDLTAPLARYVAENFDTLPKPYRSYRAGWVFRNEKPGPGRYRQFMQFDADTVGSASPAADAEMCMMAADTMKELEIPRGNYVVKVNNRKLLDGILESIGLAGEEHANQRLIILRALDKYDRLGASGVRALLGKERRDESGDITQGANLALEQIDRLMMLFEVAPQSGTRFEDLADWEQRDSAFVSSQFDRERGEFTYEILPNHGPGRLPINNHETINRLRSWFRNSTTEVEGLNELERIADLVKASKYGSKRIRIDPSVVRGLEYYTGPVYEVELTFPMSGEDGNPSASTQPVRFGSVGGGGRYDGLVARFRGEPVPASGFSIGVSRLLAALTHLGKIDAKPEPGPVIVTVFDQNRLADYQRMASELRNAGIPAELYLGAGRFGPQMKYADRRHSPCVVIQGSDEKAKAEVQIKDLILGAELAGLSKERDDYLAKQAAAQFAVPESKLVEAVRKVLARHGIA
jgi:histidyl-tRNA synthetase